MSVAPSKEEEDDFNYARTKYYRHVIGPRGAAIDRSSGELATFSSLLGNVSEPVADWRLRRYPISSNAGKL